MKLVQSHQKFQSGGRYGLWKSGNRYFVFWGAPEDSWARQEFKTLKDARRALLAEVWDHPKFQGLHFPDNNRLIRELLG